MADFPNALGFEQLLRGFLSEFVGLLRLLFGVAQRLLRLLEATKLCCKSLNQEDKAECDG